MSMISPLRKPDVSVVILTRNAGEGIEKCLSMVFAQDFGGDLEVICVDSSSSDNTAGICLSYGARLFLIKPGDFNHGLTRNFAVSQARGEYVAFLSQDAVPADSRWLSSLVANLKNDIRIAGVYSRQVPHDDADVLTRLDVSVQLVYGKERRENLMPGPGFLNDLSPAQRLELCNFDNVSSCIRKSAWKDIRFPEVTFAEDLAWARDALIRGWKIVFEPGSLVRHSHKRGLFYEFGRARIHHRRAYELFLFDPVPGIGRAVISAAKVSILQMKDILRSGSLFPGMFSAVLKAFPLALSRALGQYKGVRDAMTGCFIK